MRMKMMQRAAAVAYLKIVGAGDRRGDISLGISDGGPEIKTLG